MWNDDGELYPEFLSSWKRAGNACFHEDRTGANRIERERTGAIEGFAGLLFQERVQVKAWNDLVPSAETISEKDLA
jgi:hypothetical protein